MTNYDSYDSSRPDPNCRTCTDFKTWTKKQHKETKTQEANFSTSAADNNRLIGLGGRERKNCPWDKEEIGRATWGLLHTMAAFYSNDPTSTQKSDMRGFIEKLSRVYPCGHCAEDFRKDLELHPPILGNQTEFSKWLCDLHNRVNVKLGKPIFDCSKVNERWRDGWLDGSCD